MAIEAPGEGGTSAGNETANRPVCCLIPCALIASVRWLKGIPSTPSLPYRHRGDGAGLVPCARAGIPPEGTRSWRSIEAPAR